MLKVGNLLAAMRMLCGPLSKFGTGRGWVTVREILREFVGEVQSGHIVGDSKGKMCFIRRSAEENTPRKVSSAVVVCCVPQVVSLCPGWCVLWPWCAGSIKEILYYQLSIEGGVELGTRRAVGSK